ncbi:hypothetical protein CWI38_0445p0020 [Hamiltosporidium tvaerminnensis]|uniref:Uncharacterized protein n=1 Tax=Hamiltosporidium tvaerminnensis TaxID=1176355 RepID=A0A4Q9LYM4_9MICR|nr:hypothetical protein CWI38_0445p0020 [Hamiltosporidium tvaerminnensis]
MLFNQQVNRVLCKLDQNRINNNIVVTTYSLAERTLIQPSILPEFDNDNSLRILNLESSNIQKIHNNQKAKAGIDNRITTDAESWNNKPDDIVKKYHKTFLKRLQISYGCRGIHLIDSVYNDFGQFLFIDEENLSGNKSRRAPGKSLGKGIKKLEIHEEPTSSSKTRDTPGILRLTNGNEI